MSYLNKEKLIEELNKAPMIAQHLDCMDVFDAINAASVDSIEIVRCGDCKWYTLEPGIWQCELYDWAHEPDWFCADGVKKDG